MKLKHGLTVFFAVYIISLSFIPLIHDRLMAEEPGWTGYGTGSYQIQNQHYFVLFNDPYDGSSKPHIHINPEFAPAARVSLLEFSDWTSWLSGWNLFDEYKVTMRAKSNLLTVNYTGTNVTISKFVEVTQDFVKVTLNSTRGEAFSGHLELWRWVMTSINGVSIGEATKPLTIPVTNRIDFTFEDERLQALGQGSILLSAPPAHVQIFPHEKGFNKITIDFLNSRMVLAVSGSTKAIGTPSLGWDYSMLPSILPIVAIAVVAVYLLVDNYGRALKNRASRISR